MTTTQQAVSSITVTQFNENYEETINEWLEEDISDVEDADKMMESNHSTDTETEGDENENETATSNIENLHSKYFMGRTDVNGQPQNLHKIYNIVIHLHGLKPAARVGIKVEPIIAWTLIFSDEMVNLIVRWTNVKLSAMRNSYRRSTRPEMQDVDAVEI